MKATIVYDNEVRRQRLKAGRGFSAGELEGVEQSLALKTEKGIFVVTE